MFRYGKFSGFLKQKPFLGAGVFVNTWLWKWMGKCVPVVSYLVKIVAALPLHPVLCCGRALSPLPIPPMQVQYHFNVCSLPRAQEILTVVVYAFNSWAVYASLIAPFLLIMTLLIDYYATRLIWNCLEAVNIFRTSKSLTGFPQLSCVYAEGISNFRKSVLSEEWSIILHLNVYQQVKTILVCWSLIRTSQSMQISYEMQVSFDMESQQIQWNISEGTLRNANISCTRHWNLLQMEINKFNRNFDPNGSLVASYRFFFKSLTASHSVLQRKKWRLLLNETFFKTDQTAQLLTIGQFRS